MKAVSLFAGVGGFDLALSRAGIDVVAAVEIDKHCRAVLGRHFPNTTLLEDVCNVTGEQLREFGFDSDGIIVGGFPCQDLSVAGKRAGLGGSRSGLFWEIHRLLEETQAKWFILENVPGLLSSNGGRDMGIVLGSLADLGYGVAYRVLDAQYFGVAQRRKRVFIVGRLGDDGHTPGEILDLIEGSSGDNHQSEQTGQNTTSSANGGALARQRGFGDYEIDQVAGALKARDYKDATDLVLNQPYVKVIRSGARAEDGSLPAEVWAERDVSPTLNVMDNTGESRATVITVFQPHYSAAIQGNMIGRSDTAGPQGKGYSESGPMFTLTQTDQHAVATSSVRRLTPVECERLQGFPDDWTAGQADGHRYKQMGNAVAVPCVAWVINRLIREAQ